MPKTFIAFSGEAGSGKDYVADILVREYGFVRVSFSDQLKTLATRIYPWMQKDYSPQEKELPLNIEVGDELITSTPRQIWLHLNNLRKIENGIFIRMLEENLALLNVDKILISDIRTQEEFDWCTSHGFTTVYISCEKSIHEQNSFDDFTRSLSDKTDLILENDMNGSSFIHTFMDTYENKTS